MKKGCRRDQVCPQFLLLHNISQFIVWAKYFYLTVWSLPPTRRDGWKRLDKTSVILSSYTSSFPGKLQGWGKGTSIEAATSWAVKTGSPEANGTDDSDSDTTWLPRSLAYWTQSSNPQSMWDHTELSFHACKWNFPVVSLSNFGWCVAVWSTSTSTVWILRSQKLQNSMDM